MIEWLDVLRNQYPGVDLTRTVSDRVQALTVPLFADDTFKKDFGVSYPSLSDAERKEFFRTHVIPCRTSREYANQTLLGILGPPFHPGVAG